jgi:hypothetical protein
MCLSVSHDPLPDDRHLCIVSHVSDWRWRGALVCVEIQE